MSYREILTGQLVAAHTEYTRLLAEHGILGILAGAILGVMFLQCMYKYRKNPTGRDIMLGLWVWAFIFFAHSAMRVVAPSFAIALTFVTLAPPQLIIETVEVTV